MTRAPTYRSAASGFTLLEMLVIIALILLLVALLLPALQNVEEKTWRVQCMNHMRQLMHATILYTADFSGYLPHSTWGGLDDANRPSWAYDGRSGYNAADVTGGAIWPYLMTKKVYRCPADAGPWNCSASKMSSYVMNGAVSAYGKTAETPHSWKLVLFKGTDICYWEADEDSVNPSSCVNGSDICNGQDLGQYPFEGISQRHKTGANVACFDGHVEWLFIQDYYAMGAKPPCVSWRTRLWCNPGTADGH